tara:strand:+ start:541 stop:747 length:207 start_codon:yes stop_codon:yes gene_type:complete
MNLFNFYNQIDGYFTLFTVLPFCRKQVMDNLHKIPEKSPPQVAKQESDHCHGREQRNDICTSLITLGR